MSKSLTATRTLMQAALLLAISTSVSANRPAMDEDIEEYEAASDAPSAVEMMMQQDQQQQTGDVLTLPAQEIQPGETVKVRLLDKPRRGSSMQKVRNEYGEPLSTTEQVGQPPISSWIYADRVVYFEYSTVLHVVAR